MVFILYRNLTFQMISMFINIFPTWGLMTGPHIVGDLRFHYPFVDIWSSQCK